MDETEWLAERFEQHRPRLRAVAYRMLGSLAEADDAVQDACGAYLPDPVITADGDLEPEQEALLAEGVGLALLVVLDSLTPAERLAFVLHDMFELPCEEIAGMVGRTPTAAAAARQPGTAPRERRRDPGARPGSDASAAGGRRLLRGGSGRRLRRPRPGPRPRRRAARRLRRRPAASRHPRRAGSGQAGPRPTRCPTVPRAGQRHGRSGGHHRRAALLRPGLHRRQRQDRRDRRYPRPRPRPPGRGRRPHRDVASTRPCSASGLGPVIRYRIEYFYAARTACAACLTDSPTPPNGRGGHRFSGVAYPRPPFEITVKAA